MDTHTCVLQDPMYLPSGEKLMVMRQLHRAAQSRENAAHFSAGFPLLLILCRASVSITVEYLMILSRLVETCQN